MAAIDDGRGILGRAGRLLLSGICKWDRPDCGRSEESVVRHLQQDARPGLAEKLKSVKGDYSYGYGWGINAP